MRFRFQTEFTSSLMVALCLFSGPALLSQAAKTSSPVATEPAPAQVPAPVAATGTELDQVVAIVNGDLVLESDVDEERRFETLQPYRDTSVAASRERTIERLINRALILQQARLQPESAISDADLNKDIDALRKSIPACKQYACETPAGWTRYLADNGFNEATFNTRWRERMQVLGFIEERFRMGIKIPAADVQAYYDKTLLPQYAKQKVTPPKLAAISPRIEEILLQQQVSNLLRDWLKSLRAQGSVVVLHPGEAAP